MQHAGTLRSSIAVALACALACDTATGAQFFPTTTAQLIADINTANANGFDDLIDLGGLTFTLTAVDNNTDGSNGLPSITGSGFLFISNGTIQRSGGTLFRLLHVAPGVLINLDNVVLFGGHAGAGNGGAIYNRGALTVRTSRLENNTGTTGGAIFNDAFASLTVSNSLLTGNFASSGGALANAADGQVASLANSTLSGNQASNDGGAVMNFGMIGLIANCTFTNNTAGRFGGGVASYLNGLLLQVRSTIVAGNTAAMQGPDLSASPTEESNNLIGNNNGTDVLAGNPNANGSWVGTLEAPLDAGLVALANNGGLTATHALLYSSVALDHGSNPQAFQFDQRGTPFPRTFGATTDIGAFEYDPKLFKDGFE